MALKDLLKLVDDKLESVFHQKPHDPAKDRQRFIKGIDRTRTQFTATEPQRGRKWFSAKNNVVKFSPGIPIAGKDTHWVPSERFPEYLNHLKKACEAGELDDVLGTSGQPTRGGGQRKRSGWSAERRAAYEARKKK